MEIFLNPEFITYMVFNTLLTSLFLFGDMKTSYKPRFLSESNARKFDLWVKTDDKV